MQTEPHTLLQQVFGYSEFRPFQKDIIETVYHNKDCLVVMPTGGGKSICYQIPALMKPGLTLVISPLISLMQDQVSSLRANGVNAAFLNSSQSLSEQNSLIEELMMAEIRLLYVSPEKLMSEDVIRLLGRIKVNLIAVDEAHCISQWGHDFRPEYAMLGRIRDIVPETPVVALTATADRLTRQDIAEKLNLKDPEIYVASFDRPNLHLKVLPGRKRFQEISSFIRTRPGQSGIIYCLSRKSTEAIATKLQAQGIKAAFYHAGMTGKARHRVQEQFLNDEVPIICATIAFGMGIDKPNVRWVIHYNLPKNIEGYYQEIGRAGRDGLPSDTVLFYSYGDVIQQQRFLEESGQREVMETKLERMQQYATASMCRRRILLQYFGESLPKDCGHCDVCDSPPEQFDGTILVQKALSAVARVREQAGMQMIIDILRGSQRQDLLAKGYQQIKTYGAGRDVPARDWQEYMIQMINLGLLDIAYEYGNVLTLTDRSKEVLLGQQRVSLVKPTREAAKTSSRPEPTLSQKDLFFRDLEHKLKIWRKEQAAAEGLRPYHVFTDATLESLIRELPLLEDDLPDVQGLGAQKQKKYGTEIRRIIHGHLLASLEGEGYYPRSCSQKITLSCYLEGWEVRIMADKRKLKDSTICSHLVKLHQEGYDLDLKGLMDHGAFQRVKKAFHDLGKEATMRQYFDYFGGEISYGNIRLGLAVLGG